MPARRLIVTNGRSAAGAIRRTGTPFEAALSWDDVLHEGPVRDHSQDSAFRRERSEYLARRGYGSARDILAAFTRRDEALDRGLREFDEVVLWFEHDLYDQLQLLHVLSRIARSESATHVLVVNVDQFIAEADRDTLAESFRGRRLAGDEAIGEGLRGWQALTAPTPEPLAILAAGTTSELLPHLPSAATRMLQELCEPSTGLSRSQLQILNVLMEGPQHPAVLFRRCAEMEEARFMGDWSFWAMASELCHGANRLIVSPAGSPRPELWRRIRCSSRHSSR